MSLNEKNKLFTPEKELQSDGGGLKESDMLSAVGLGSCSHNTDLAKRGSKRRS